MKLHVTTSAVECFQKEWGFARGDVVRIFVRCCGMSEDGPYWLGIQHDRPMFIGLMAIENHITFYMEEQDVWFLEGHNLTIDCEGEEIKFFMPSA
ncbi:HesB/YadR/YfhF family protein [Paenibacillus terrigena]|uniref:HesB/YadR/YfhF family protein n=1 Tax=Paenibacillus terrigena TaxID=369333 RepID=UPI00035E81D5|nr:hypothetical protein [Paenibacillus terrigena]